MLIPHRIDDGKGDSVSDGHEAGARPPGYRLMLREMAADERPREKLKLRGSAALSDGELLAIILNTGIGDETLNDPGLSGNPHSPAARSWVEVDWSASYS